jgi:glycosyltransferase involved in cell wall biosynthesis
MTGLLADAGETVHIIAHRWSGAPRHREERADGRLVIHRVGLDDRVASPDGIARGLIDSTFPSQAFAWQAALLAETLVVSEGIDVIEAQEWEAPLYYFQLRRALGVGPARRPPCVVHLHSPSEQIFSANGWDTAVADYAPAIALEQYSIEHADALLAPSRYLADQALARYAITPSSVHVIPYPLGDVPHVERTAATWERGAIGHVGRLELRKGVLELADAVAQLDRAAAPFTLAFVGGDMPLSASGGSTVGGLVRSRLPRAVRTRVRFHGLQERSDVFRILGQCSAVVVPSRWENFPYGCIEAMASGLPVIASPNGGMRELVTDGVSGWIAADQTAAGLAAALRRALAVSGDERRRMGRAAEETVRRVCDNDAIVERHRELKKQLTARTPSTAPASVQRRVGLVVTCTGETGPLDSCISGIRAQTEPATAVCVAAGVSPGPVAGWRVFPEEPGGRDAHVMSAVQWLVSSGTHAVAFVDARLQLDAACLSRCRTAFDCDDRVGIVSGWTRDADSGRVHVQPLPAVPYLWRDAALAAFVAVRVRALVEAIHGGGRAFPASLRDVFDAVTRAGWKAVTYPAIFGSISLSASDRATGRQPARYSSMAQAVQRLHTPLLQWLRTCSSDDRRAFLLNSLLSPRRSARSVVALITRWGAIETDATFTHATRRAR